MVIDHFAALRKAPPVGTPSNFEAPAEDAPVASAPAAAVMVEPAARPEGKATVWRRRSGQLQTDYDISAEWADGVAAIEMMERPAEATEGRWKQIVQDALRFAVSWSAAAQAHGWTISDVFGFDMNEETGAVGLALEIKGGRVTLMDRNEVVIRNGAARRIHRRGAAAHAEPIWTLGKRK